MARPPSGSAQGECVRSCPMLRRAAALSLSRCFRLVQLHRARKGGRGGERSKLKIQDCADKPGAQAVVNILVNAVVCIPALVAQLILPVLKEPWTSQTCPLYRHMGDGDLTALAQSLYDRITEDLKHSEEFAFFRGSPEYEQLRSILKETVGASE